MKSSRASLDDQIKDALQLPLEAGEDDVLACVLGCLTDALDCRLEKAPRSRRESPRHRAVWQARDGSRYEGEGDSDREAALAAALRLIVESSEAAILRAYAEPELHTLKLPRDRKVRPKNFRGAVAPGALTPVEMRGRRVRQPGMVE